MKRARGKSNKNSHGNSSNPVKVTEDGVYFKSYRDGRKIFLTPESTVQAQKSYGADIIIPLDQLPPYHIDRQVLEDSVDRSHRWEARSLHEHLLDVKKQAMYCVVHGGVDVKLRTKSIDYLTSLPFDGYAIGGSLGKDSSELADLLEWMMPNFEREDRKMKPRHLLGTLFYSFLVLFLSSSIDFCSINIRNCGRKKHRERHKERNRYSRLMLPHTPQSPWHFTHSRRTNPY